MDVFKIIAILIAFLGTAKCYCYTRTYYAYTYSQYRSVTYYSYDHCTIYIRPSYSGSNYYLQISWATFNVKGDMPTCSKDYVQVYLTSSYKSIGKFCSNNGAIPFTMYSYDGYAKIVYKADSSTNGNFAFRYELKYKTSEKLGDGYLSSCVNTYQSSSSSQVYSKYWPQQYLPSLSPCQHTIYRSSSYDVTKIVFMDLNLNPSDCIELRGSNTSSSYMTHTIDTRICSTSSIKTYTVYDRYIQIKFNRGYGSSSYRGFVAGYVSYNLIKTTPAPGTTTLSATSSSGYKYVSYNNNDYRTIYIRPASGYSSSNYYLKISWSSFYVKGDMPSCSRDYVQVYLTQSYKSIGKFCSNNAGSPFTMYSHDGYAKIVYKADYSTSGYFAFRYELKSKSSELLGTSTTSCPGTYNYGSSGTVYSRNWPEKYSPSSSPCKHTIYRSSLYDVTKIVFMDLDLHTSPYYGDCMELRGSNTSSSYMTHTIDTRICSTSSIKTYTVYDRYIEIKFNRRYGTSSDRGFVAGYVSYDLPKVKPKSSSSSIAATTAVRIIAPLVVIGVVVFVFLKYRARMRARNANPFAFGVAAPAPQTNITATSTVTTNAAVIGDSAATSYPPPGYPKSTDPVASNAPPSYPVASAYPPASTPYPNQSYPPPAYQFTANPTSDGTVPVYPSYPTGNFGYPTENAGESTGNATFSSGNPTFSSGNPAYQTGNQEFQTGNPGYPTETNTASVTLPPISNQGVTFSSHGDQHQPIVPPIEQNNGIPTGPPPAYPSAPPPAYNTVQN